MDNTINNINNKLLKHITSFNIKSENIPLDNDDYTTIIHNIIIEIYKLNDKEYYNHNNVCRIYIEDINNLQRFFIDPYNTNISLKKIALLNILEHYIDEVETIENYSDKIILNIFDEDNDFIQLYITENSFYFINSYNHVYGYNLLNKTLIDYFQ